ncbi:MULTISPECIES: DoxX family protein [Thermocrispum]|jgi:uncharacterized membrane protein YphA (DoxX/SURF4 family)|uniref:DoxX family protein n=1 Tax=Thermocrispum agreste TaxID=37925 RepID=A0A2W4JDZ1_9PSEU|nr:MULTISPECIES: DoxX family protein [Thermocrispum]PZM96298.1 MAG: DoxX family protein [Thermocrispum agreste]
MNTAAWAVQVILAVMLFGAGLAKATQKREQLQALSPNMAWTEDFGDVTIRLIGIAEVLGALGLILPLWTGIAPVLTPVAAVGLTVIMIGAAVTHLRRNEFNAMAPPVVLAAGAIFVAWARFSGVA